LNWLRFGLAAAVIALQLGWNVYARTTPTRYFCWAPFDVQNEYEISAEVAGQKLTEKEIAARYRRPAKGVEQRPIAHVFDFVERVERDKPAAEQAKVVIEYRVNGRDPQEWWWP
jgi:hypothetical protein